MKEYCTCRTQKRGSEFTNLYAAGALVPVVKSIYVHVKCFKPFELPWRFSIKPCARCEVLFASPWETWCKRCTTLAGEDWLGWSEARELELEFMRNLLGYKSTQQVLAMRSVKSIEDRDNLEAQKYHLLGA